MRHLVVVCAALLALAGTGIRPASGAASSAALSTPPSGSGYLLAATDGGVFAFGHRFHGSAAGLQLNRPVVGIAATSDGDGYWLVASDGGVFAYGDARFRGSAGGLRLNAPVVGIASTPDGGGYWLLALDGGVFAFGDAGYFGSMAGLDILGSPVGMVSTSDGRGYEILTTTGEVFSFGDALAPGAPPAVQFALPGASRYAGIARVNGTVRGYVVVTGDGAQRFGGDAQACTAVEATVAGRPAIVGVATPNTSECTRWLAASDGGVFAFLAPFHGSASNLALHGPIVGIAS